jgi:formate hydrogenlyase subunit 3/multisubunit Na+/H+ antiporter MnhD subunit
VTAGETLLLATLAVPVVLLLAGMSRRVSYWIPKLLAVAPVPGLAAALLVPTGTMLVLPEPPFRMILVIDPPGAMLLGTAALLWIIAGAYASAHLRADPDALRFAEWWLLTLTGSLGVFIAADLVSFYLTYSMVSLAAWGLIVHDRTTASRAGMVYLALAVLGEAFLLMAFVYMAAATANGSLLIRDAVAALPTSPWRGVAMTLLVLGFGLKIALVPGHVWMPLAYSAAPAPAAAALSGAAVKAGIIGFIRFLPLGAELPQWGEALVVLGLLSAFYGVVVGITQKDPKSVLAYSSISQMGLLAAALGMGLAAGDAATGLVMSFAAASHVLAKGGLFLAYRRPSRSARSLRRRIRGPAIQHIVDLGGRARCRRRSAGHCHLCPRDLHLRDLRPA